MSEAWVLTGREPLHVGQPKTNHTPSAAPGEPGVWFAGGALPDGPYIEERGDTEAVAIERWRVQVRRSAPWFDLRFDTKGDS